MASSKRKFDDGDSNWEVTQVVKPPKVTAETAAAELQEDRGNYGSRASQRPRRERKRPERFADQLYQPVSKKKETPKRETADKTSFETVIGYEEFYKPAIVD